jgi:hypothetical protein
MSDETPLGLSSSIDGELFRALSGFQDASTQLLHDRVLQQRVDRKHLLPQVLLAPLLNLLRTHYAVVRSAGQLVATYDTLYFDTSELRTYEDHRRGRCPRCKVRLRHHLDRRLSFLEIKRKVGTRTSKVRLPRVFGDIALDATAARFIDAHCLLGATNLMPRLSIAYRRITLLGREADERITIDFGIEFRGGGRREALPGVTIVEIKQQRYSNRSDAARVLRTLHVRERTISKYCVGVAMTAPVRTNVFKPMLRDLERLSA